jgi:hypothetical protein
LHPCRARFFAALYFAALIRTLVALGGIQAHSEYHLSKPEFGGRPGIEVGI